MAKNGLRSVSAPLLLRMDVREWPPVAARIHDLSLPRAVIPHPAPAPYGQANINIILDLLDRVAGVEGSVAECGVFRGNTLVPFALYLKSRQARKCIHAFDSFEGFPQEGLNEEIALSAGGDPNKTTTGFTNTSYDLVRRKLMLFGLDKVALHKGYFQDTLGECSGERFSFVHLDCDLYQSYKDCLEFFYPRLNRGGIVLLDEYNDPPWPGCNKAVDEFLTGKPERLEEIDRQNYQKWFFMKV